MHIERATCADDELVAALARLIPQLNPKSGLPTRDDLAAMIASPGTHLLIARDPGCDLDLGPNLSSDIVGTLTLTLFRIPVGMQGRINTVVVDVSARGRGIGEALTREAIAISRAAGVRRITLSSRNERAAAHRMYRRLGFETTPNEQFHMLL